MRTRVNTLVLFGGAPVGAFEAFVDLLSVDSLLPGNMLLTTRATSAGWNVFTRKEGVEALRFVVGSIGSAEYVLHSGQIGDHAVGGRTHSGITNPAFGPLEISRFHGLCEKGRRGCDKRLSSVLHGIAV